MNEQRQDVHNSEVPNLCQSCEARHRGICGALTPEQLVILSRSASQKTVAPGDVLVHDAEPVTRYANITSGVVKLSKVLADGRQQIVGLQFAPDFLGRPMTEESRLTAEAASVGKICAFPKSTLDSMIRQSPDLEHKLLQQALKELDEARNWMVTLGRKSAKEKVASFLYLIAMNLDPETEVDQGGSASFELPLSRGDIADFLGLTIETVSRQMTRLRQSEVIAFEHHREIRVADLERLMEEAGD